jgi:hypothetical protein
MCKPNVQQPEAREGGECQDRAKKPHAGAHRRPDGDPIEGRPSEQEQGGGTATQGGGGGS